MATNGLSAEMRPIGGKSFPRTRAWHSPDRANMASTETSVLLTGLSITLVECLGLEVLCRWHVRRGLRTT
jgi:hypothetical protein